MSLDFIPYPDLDNGDFYKKIYYKKEFYDTKPDPLPDPSNQSNETVYKLFQKNKDFKLQSGQMFLRNYISDATPYKGVLVFHGTGTGKTCASIVIAERFHDRVNETGKKVLIIANPTIQNEFLDLGSYTNLTQHGMCQLFVNNQSTLLQSFRIKIF